MLISAGRDRRPRSPSWPHEIDADYAGRELLLVGVLKGAAMFMSDLARALDRPSTMEFMAVSSYGSVDDSPPAWCGSSRTSTATSPASTS